MSKPKVTGAKAASSASKTLKGSASALTQKASQVKAPAKTGKVSLTAARSAVMSVNKSRGKK